MEVWRIRQAREEDIPALLALYAYMSNTAFAGQEENATQALREITTQTNQHLLVEELEGQVVCSLTVTVLQSLTHGCRPYAVVEHVVTDPACGGKGCASRLLQAAEQLARGAGCYKCMLITSRSQEHVHRLYQKAGYSSEGYTAYTRYLT